MDSQRFYNNHIGMSLDDFVLNNEGLAYKVANEYRATAYANDDDFEDYEQTCLLALVKAYHDYDPTKVEGVKASPSTYAITSIRFTLSRYVNNKNNMIKYPRNIISAMYRIHKLESIDPDYRKVAEQIDMDPEVTKEALVLIDAHKPVSLNSKTKFSSSSSKEVILEDTLGKFGDFSVIYVNDFISRLTDQEKLVISMHMNGKNQREISEVIGVHQTRVSRILKKVAEKLHVYYMEANEVFYQ